MEFDSDYRPDDTARQKGDSLTTTTILNCLFEPGLVQLKEACRGSEYAQNQLARLEEWLQGASPAQIYECASLYSVIAQQSVLLEQFLSIADNMDSIGREQEDLLKVIGLLQNHNLANQQGDASALHQFIERVNAIMTLARENRWVRRNYAQQLASLTQSVERFQERQMRAQDELVLMQGLITRMQETMAQSQGRVLQMAQIQSQMIQDQNQIGQAQGQMEFMRKMYEDQIPRLAQTQSRMAQIQQLQTERAALLTRLQDRLAQMQEAQDEITKCTSQLLEEMRKNTRLDCQ